MSKLWFKFLLFLAGFGLFRYTGLRGNEPPWMPKGVVVYRDGNMSVPMPLGNALDYAWLDRPAGLVIHPTEAAARRQDD